MYLGAKRHYINTLPFLSFPKRILPGAKFTLRPSLVLSYIGSVTALHSSSGRQPNFVASSRGRHLYLAGQPATAKLLIPSVVIILGTDSIPVRADRRCIFPAMAEIARLSSASMRLDDNKSTF